MRLDPAVVDRIDALRPRFSSEWYSATRSDVLQTLLMFSLEQMEQDPVLIVQMGARGAKETPRATEELRVPRTGLRPPTEGSEG